MSVEQLKKYITTSESEEMLKDKLSSLESLIRKYTNNNFQVKNIRFRTSVNDDGTITVGDTSLLKVGDTVEISQSLYNDGVYTIEAITEAQILTLSEVLLKHDKLVVTKVKYPKDVILGVVNLMKWELENRDKVGIKSESISRHSVTYYDLDANSLLGYPRSLLAFLQPYMKARF